MLSVLAFKRSLSAGILDGGLGEISLGGSRLNRFMKDVENVTGRMGQGEAMPPSEEAANVLAATEQPKDTTAANDVGEAAMKTDGGRATSADTETDPWSALLQVGTQLFSALAAAGDPSAGPHPWIERDPTTGARNLKIPLPPPETAKKLADVLSAFADNLRGKAR